MQPRTLELVLCDGHDALRRVIAVCVRSRQRIVRLEYEPDGAGRALLSLGVEGGGALEHTLVPRLERIVEVVHIEEVALVGSCGG